MSTVPAVLTENQRIEIVARRIFAYYLQIIAFKKKAGSTSFVIDNVPGEDVNVGLVRLEDKYDGKSYWRQALGIPNDGDAWHTLGSNETKSFSEMGASDNGKFFIDMEKVLQAVSLLLSKQGIANYFDKPNADLATYFYKSDKAWLYIVL